MLNALIKKVKMNKNDCLFIGDSEHDEAALNSKVDFCLNLMVLHTSQKHILSAKNF